jgi:hypothetical protein
MRKTEGYMLFLGILASVVLLLGLVSNGYGSDEGDGPFRTCWDSLIECLSHHTSEADQCVKVFISCLEMCREDYTACLLAGEAGCTEEFEECTGLPLPPR